jgi:hypothetical protein
VVIGSNSATRKIANPKKLSVAVAAVEIIACEVQICDPEETMVNEVEANVEMTSASNKRHETKAKVVKRKYSRKQFAL